MSHLVVSTPKLEGEHWLQIFSLDQDVTFQAVAEIDCMREWRSLDDIVYFGCQDQTKVLQT